MKAKEIRAFFELKEKTSLKDSLTHIRDMQKIR